MPDAFEVLRVPEGPDKPGTSSGLQVDELGIHRVPAEPDKPEVFRAPRVFVEFEIHRGFQASVGFEIPQGFQASAELEIPQGFRIHSAYRVLLKSLPPVYRIPSISLPPYR